LLRSSAPPSAPPLKSSLRPIVDGDGDVDLVVTGPNIGPSAQGNTDIVSVLVNRGDGTFEAAVQYPLVWQPFGLVVEDLDGDGMPEVATANQGSHNVAVFQNRGDGTLQPVTYLPSGSGPVQIEAVDLDGDGDRDLVTANAGFGSVSTLRNTSGSLPAVGCTEFVRGDINADGFVSVSDAIMFEREGSEGPFEIGCDDAADVIDDEVLDICDVAAVYHTLFDYPDWTQSIAPPTLAPGHDPTPLGIPYQEHHCPDIYKGGEDRPLPNPLGCRRYEPQAAPETDDVVRLGDVEAVPGTMTRVPVYLTASVPTDAVQLVVAYDPSQVELAADNDALSYEGSYYEKYFGEWMTITYNDGHSTSSFYYPQSAGLSKLTVHPSYGVFSVLIGGHLFFAGFEVPPGEETLIGWIHLRVLPTVEPDAQIVLAPTNGDNNQGVGPYRMRNEITSKGRARYVGTLPQLGAARLSIVGDQSFFRGDSNSDDTLNISDPIQTLGWLFLGDSDLTCLDAADANDDGKVDLSDAVFTLGYLFGGGSALPPPSGERGPRPHGGPSPLLSRSLISGVAAQRAAGGKRTSRRPTRSGFRVARLDGP
jgi:hypothetical protein